LRILSCTDTVNTNDVFRVSAAYEERRALCFVHQG